MRALLLCLLMACSSPTVTSSTSDATVPPSDATADTVVGDAGFCPPPVKPEKPGPYVTDTTTKGCGGKTLGDFIAAAYALMPALSDITKLYDPATTMFDGSFIYAFALPAGGFAIAFKRGGGDCPAGCTENEWWYFQTDASCVLKQVGHYHPTYGSGCVNMDGTPMWATPIAPDPTSVCGGDTTPKNISGTYTFCASGSKTACTEKGGAEKAVSFGADIKVVIAQKPEDLTKGTVTVTGVGHPKIDGIAFEATFTRQRVSAAKSYSNLPAKCPDEWSFNFDYDFENIITPGKLRLFESHAIGCSETTGGGSYCKGLVGLDLVAR